MKWSAVPSSLYISCGKGEESIGLWHQRSWQPCQDKFRYERDRHKGLRWENILCAEPVEMWWGVSSKHLPCRAWVASRRVPGTGTYSLPAPGLSSMFQTSCDRESSLSHLFTRFRWESVARDWKTQKGAKWDPEFPGLQQQTYLMGFFKWVEVQMEVWRS